MRRASMRRDKLHHPVLTANPMLEASEKPTQPIMLHPHNPDTHLGYADAPWALRLRKEYFSPVEKLSSGWDLALVYHQVGGVCYEWVGLHVRGLCTQTQVATRYLCPFCAGGP